MFSDPLPLLGSQLANFLADVCQAAILNRLDLLRIQRTQKPHPIDLIELLQRTSRKPAQQPGVDQLLWDFGATPVPFPSDEGRTRTFPRTCRLRR